MTSTRRALTIDDPLAAAEACHAARQPAAGQPDRRLRAIPIEDIHPNPDQPRKHFDEEALRSLAESIRERGVLQPIIVRPSVTGGYELVTGERRWRAAQLAGQASVPTLIDTNVEGAESLELALIENVVREDLTPIEEARTIAVLIDDLKVTATELAKRLGRSRTDLAHTLRLLDLPDQAVDLIDTGALTKGHGKALLAEPDHHRRRVLAERAARDGWAIRVLETEIARGSKPRAKPQPPHGDHEATAARLQDALTRATGFDAQARPHRLGYQVILDHTAGDRLIRFLGGRDTGN